MVVGGRTDNAETYAYTLDEIFKMLDVLENETYRTAVLVAAFEGLRLQELRGLRWQDISANEISVENTYWRNYEGTTKTPSSKDKVPLIGIVAEALKQHRKRNPLTKYVFESPIRARQPLDLSSAGKHIEEALSGSSRVTWHGWQAFRRGLASNLSELGVKDEVIQVILRHANVEVTRQFYIKRRSQGARAMAKLEKVVRKKLETR